MFSRRRVYAEIHQGNRVAVAAVTIYFKTNISRHNARVPIPAISTVPTRCYCLRAFSPRKPRAAGTYASRSVAAILHM